MEQTPEHEGHNPELLQLIPPQSVSVIEIGCSTGALAREFKKINPRCNYFGVDIEPRYVDLARRYCDRAEALDIEAAPDAFYEANRSRDAWIFGDSLEHFRDPWQVLRNIRTVIPHNGSIVACIPNAQHWMLQVKLSIGDFRYEPSGLLDKTHLRWFTRQTIIELFTGCGFTVVAGVPRVFQEPKRDKFLPIIGNLASAAGADPAAAVNDALALQYVVRAVPA